MAKPKVYIRADGNTQMGLGHIHRSLALADYLKDDFEISFCVFQPGELVIELVTVKEFKIVEILNEDYNNPENFVDLLNKDIIVVLDGYNFKTEYQEKVIKNGNRLVVIDDLNEWEQVADVVINHAYSGSKGVYKVSDNTKLYSGLNYVLLKKEFLGAVNRHAVRQTTNNILVCIGGTDPQNYSEEIVNSLITKTNKKITLVTYKLNRNFDRLKDLASNNRDRVVFKYSLSTKDLIETIADNDVAILQPSNIALEAAAIGICLMLIQTAENQKFVKSTLVNADCAINIQLKDVGKVLNSVSLSDINDQIKKQKHIFDSKAQTRILDIFKSLQC